MTDTPALTAEEIAGMEKRANEATEGPWVFDTYNNIWSRLVLICSIPDHPSGEEEFTAEQAAEKEAWYKESEANASFMAYARYAVPALISHVRALEGFVEHWQTKCAATRELSNAHKARAETAEAQLERLRGAVPDLTHVDAVSAYHNWLEQNDIAHTPDLEKAFSAAWNIYGSFIAGPEQQAVDWSVVCEAIWDATDIDGIGPQALEASFHSSGLLVLHRAARIIKGETQ